MGQLFHFGGALVTLKVELERLHRLGTVLHGLADEAGGLKTGFTYSSPPSVSTGVPLQDAVYNASRSVPTSVTEALSINRDLIDTTLVSAIKERLGETGDVMQNVANEYRDADEALVSVQTVTTIYTHATGDWDVPEMGAR
ncbi:hypothetical protein [Mycolicibacterium fortuitum]|uniref:hypothetical protein n=1 Tax=Mycolicibacterium fortuitum TaxID=1766 RepID=UPI002603B8EC|nr:hypothetical protein [Mycolicibacterium fortuitum]